MGMYAEINGEEVKFSGRLAEAASIIGVRVHNGTATLSHEQACLVVHAMVQMFKAGVTMVLVDDIAKLESDAHKLRLLANWTHEHYQPESIHFC